MIVDKGGCNVKGGRKEGRKEGKKEGLVLALSGSWGFLELVFAS